MKSDKKRVLCSLFGLLCINIFFAFPASAANIYYEVSDFELLNLLNSLMPTTITILLTLGPIVIVVMAVRYIVEEDPQGKSRIKKHIIDFCIGYIVIFILIAVVNIFLPTLIIFTNEQIQKGLADGTLLS